MSASLDAGQLRDLLRAEFRARLEPEGWEMLGGADDHHPLAAFRYALDHEFAATGEVRRAFSFPDRPPVLVTHVFVGVSYEPLRRLSPLLGLYGDSVIHEDVWPDMPDEDEGEDEGQEEERGEERLEVKTAGDAERAAERLASLILARAVPFAEQYASLDRLLAEFSGDTYIALLAAAGRFDEARESLARLQPPAERSRFTRRQRRATRQLRRWIDSAGDPSLIPSSPPANRFSGPKRSSVSEVWSESRARQAAVKEVKAAARVKTREQARGMLHDALTRRGVEAESPLWVENTLDHLWDSAGDQVQLGIKMLKGAARFGLGAAKAIRERQFPDLSSPDWLEPPDDALYEVAHSGRWIATDLDPDAGPWLDRVHEAAPHPLGTAVLTAWIRSADNDDAEASVIEVYLGEGRVGRIQPQDADAFSGVISDAAFRDEHPCLEARLTRRGSPPEFLLELGKPG